MTTRRRRAILTLLPALAILVAACGGSAGDGSPSGDPRATTTGGPAAPASSAPASPATGATGGPAVSPAGSSPDPAPTGNPVVDALAARPWASATLTDVTTGEPFTIASLGGRTIFVETMAIWCSNCRAQQGRFAEALAGLDPDRVAYVVLTVDPGETADDLARYKAQRGFTGRYAVAGREVAAALQAEFGPNALNPPSVPLVLISAGGDVSFRTGGESVEDIIAIAGA